VQARVEGRAGSGTNDWDREPEAKGSRSEIYDRQGLREIGGFPLLLAITDVTVARLPA
jgi:hypothetical protein